MEESDKQAAREAAADMCEQLNLPFAKALFLDDNTIEEHCKWIEKAYDDLWADIIRRTKGDK